ncbi:MAG: hypothetical protein ACLT0Y_08225 [Christensenellales bacterium]
MKASERLLLVIAFDSLGAVMHCAGGMRRDSDGGDNRCIGRTVGAILVVILALCICLLAVRCMWIGLGEAAQSPADGHIVHSPTGDVRIAQEAVRIFAFRRPSRPKACSLRSVN